MKRSHIILCVFLVVVLLAAGGLFQLKSAIERECAASVNHYFTEQGLVPKAPIETSLNLISRTLKIHPFDIQSNPKLKIKKCTFEEADLSLTWQGLLAFSPLSSFVQKSGEIVLLDSGNAKGVQMSVEDADLSLKNTRVSRVVLDAQDLEKLKSGKTDILRQALIIDEIVLDNMTITVPNQKNLNVSLGPITVTGTRKNRIEQCVVENIVVTENKVQQLAIKKVTQKSIRLHTEDEWLALAVTMSEQSQEMAGALFELLMGEDPLVGSTVFDSLTVTVENSPLAIDQITFNTTKNAENALFSVSRMTLPSKAIEDQAGQRLPLPAVSTAR